MQKGFIALPILGMILLGTLLVGGGGYAVYKINQLESANDEKVAELEEKLNQMATTSEPSQVTATSTEPQPEVLTPEEIESVVSQVTAPVSASEQSNAPTNTLPDLCSNFSGIQTAVPSGFKVSNGSCVHVEDKCSNLSGIQETIPAGMMIFSGYGCMTESEMDRINEAEKQANSARREAEELLKQCSVLKTEIYEMDQQILDIKAVYQEKIAKVQSGAGATIGEVQRYTERFNAEMYAEIAPIEHERNKKANEYNYLCTN